MGHRRALPADPAVKRAVRAQVPFLPQFPQSRARRALTTLAARLLRFSPVVLSLSSGTHTGMPCKAEGRGRG